jgi:hypothetical protein
MTKWLHALHQITGEMALHFGSELLTPEKLEEWSRSLASLSTAMADEASRMRGK